MVLVTIIGVALEVGEGDTTVAVTVIVAVAVGVDRSGVRERAIKPIQ